MEIITFAIAQAYNGVLLVVLLDFTQHARRVASRDDVRRGCPGSRPNRRRSRKVIADGDAGHTITPPPSHTLSPMEIGRADSSLSRRACGSTGCDGGEQLHVRPDLTVLADGDRCHVQGDQVEVDERPRSDVEVLAVVDVHRLISASSPRLPSAVRSVSTAEGSPLTNLLQYSSRSATTPLRDSCTFGVVGDEVTGEHSFAVGPFVTLEVVGHRTIVERMSWRARCRPLSGTTASCLYGGSASRGDAVQVRHQFRDLLRCPTGTEPRPCARPGWTRPMPST